MPIKTVVYENVMKYCSTTWKRKSDSSISIHTLYHYIGYICSDTYDNNNNTIRPNIISNTFIVIYVSFRYITVLRHFLLFAVQKNSSGKTGELVNKFGRDRQREGFTDKLIIIVNIMDSGK